VGEGEIIAKEEFRNLQDEDQTIQDLRKERPDQAVEQDGLWYHLWAKKQQLGQELLLPKPYHHVVYKLAHSIPIAGHLGRGKILSRIGSTDQLYYVMWLSIVRVVLSARERIEGAS